MRIHLKTQINATFTPVGTYRRARSCLSSQTALAMFGRRHFGVHLGTAPGGNKNKLQLCFSRIHSVSNLPPNYKCSDLYVQCTLYILDGDLWYFIHFFAAFVTNTIIFQVFRCLDGQVFAYFVGAVRKHPKVVAVISGKSSGALVDLIFCFCLSIFLSNF